MNQANIRNFCIIAHVDHGKSTLADRFLEITNTVPKEKMAEQFLDQNPISRERGITIKLAPVRMNYTLDAIPYILNLIDTPGHMDFSYEVSRTLAACEGAVLLVDATQGIQAQTVAHFREAQKENLRIIPVLNKIELPNAQVEIVTQELIDNFSFTKEEILTVSAKTGENVEALLSKIIEQIPAPKGDIEKPLRALIFDAYYDEFKGAVAYVRIIDGKLSKNSTIRFFQNNVNSSVLELGYFLPQITPSDGLSAGEIGYVVAGIKDIRQCRVGDTIMTAGNPVEPLAGYKIPKPMIFFGLYPKDQDDFPLLREALEKLTLNDTALTYTEERSSYLGSGFRVGFLGLLHAEIVKDRLMGEFNLDILLTMPQVLYEKDGESFKEPYMKLIIYTPASYVGNLMTVAQAKKGNLTDITYKQSFATMIYEMPYSMFIRGLLGEIKSASSGFASIDYTLIGYKGANLSSFEIKINGEAVDVLSELIYKDEALRVARVKAGKLKEALPKAQIKQIIQATVDGVIVAREEISPFRKDVLSGMSGGDRSRKDKLLDKQKKGKSRLLQHGKVEIPQSALLSMVEKF